MQWLANFVQSYITKKSAHVIGRGRPPAPDASRTLTSLHSWSLAHLPKPAVAHYTFDLPPPEAARSTIIQPSKRFWSSCTVTYLDRLPLSKAESRRLHTRSDQTNHRSTPGAKTKHQRHCVQGHDFQMIPRQPSRHKLRGQDLQEKQ